MIWRKMFPMPKPRFQKTSRVTLCRWESWGQTAALITAGIPKTLFGRHEEWSVIAAIPAKRARIASGLLGNAIRIDGSAVIPLAVRLGNVAAQQHGLSPIFDKPEKDL
jgi:hypothetical protein